MKRNGFPRVANALHMQQASRWSVARILSVIRDVARAVAADHALAHRAATEAALPRKNLAEVRTMFVPPLPSHRQSDESALTPDGAQRAPVAGKIRAELPCWSAPFPKPSRIVVTPQSDP